MHKIRLRSDAIISGLSKSNRSNHPLQRAGKSPFSLPLLMKFHSLLLYAGAGMRFFVFSNCHHLIQEHTTPITKLALHNHVISIDISALCYLACTEPSVSDCFVIGAMTKQSPIEGLVQAMCYLTIQIPLFGYTYMYGKQETRRMFI